MLKGKISINRYPLLPSQGAPQAVLLPIPHTIDRKSVV